MTDIAKRLSEGGLERLATQLEGGVKESFRLSAAEFSEAATTRLGGRPNLPADLEWPVWHVSANRKARSGRNPMTGETIEIAAEKIEKDTPLGFVAQIDLGSLPAIAGLDLPRSGGLYFFYGQGGKRRWEDRHSSRVLYSEQPLAGVPLREFPTDLPEEFRWKGVELAGTSELKLPGYQDAFLEQIGMSADERRLYGKILEEWERSRPQPQKSGVHRIGGYPDPVQNDPKMTAHLIALDLYDTCTKLDPQIKDRIEAFHEMNRRAVEIQRREGAGAMDWELLLQVDSEQSADILWGDAGMLYFLIRKDDLRQRRFDQTWMQFDCY